MLIISSHIDTPVNYRMTVTGRSGLLAYNNFPEVYHGEGINKAAFLTPARPVTEPAQNTTYSVTVS